MQHACVMFVYVCVCSCGTYDVKLKDNDILLTTMRCGIVGFHQTWIQDSFAQDQDQD